ncbi:hypothetical protein [Bifidobacterium adolescentis]|uniref:Uncharacterized protein n=1 Tax=Bifidobacterium adolescentis TaxID=1680 RepID=A0A1X3A1R1_BIFAD|nr:hypothetical protein [Bifidobacterium adolescentis]OSH00628.1 hypothetical protein AL0467_1028 [Bifidobacterium adolescentis]
MSDKVRVGATTIKFDVVACGMTQATARVKVPIYVDGGDDIGNHMSGVVSARVPDDFDKRVDTHFRRSPTRWKHHSRRSPRMFNRKHRKVRYAKCPYCGKSPVISEGRSITDKNELVMHYKCPKNHLTTGDTPYPNRALELWLLAVGKVLEVDDVISDYFAKQQKKGTGQ